MLDVHAGTPRHYKHLTVVPLLSSTDTQLPYVLLADAMAAGTFRITEKGTGSVPILIASNIGDTDVLILDGEQLIGARQNRTTNRSMIIAKGSDVEIPVSCMEHGRWHHVSPEMTMKSDLSPSKVRRKARDVEADHVRRRVAASTHVLALAQTAVWEQIAEYSNALGTTSASGALDHVYDQQQQSLGTWLKSFPREDGQIGLLATIGAQPLGLDVIGCRTLYGRLHERLMHGYILDAMSSQPSADGDAVSAATEFLVHVRAAEKTDASSVGKGSYKVLTGRVVGGELVDDARLVHLSAFPVLDSQVPENPLMPPSRRRRY